MACIPRVDCLFAFLFLVSAVSLVSGEADHLAIALPPQPTTDMPFIITVIAQNATNETVIEFSGNCAVPDTIVANSSDILIHNGTDWIVFTAPVPLGDYYSGNVQRQLNATLPGTYQIIVNSTCNPGTTPSLQNPIAVADVYVESAPLPNGTVRGHVTDTYYVPIAGANVSAYGAVNVTDLTNAT